MQGFDFGIVAQGLGTLVFHQVECLEFEHGLIQGIVNVKNRLLVRDTIFNGWCMGRYRIVFNYLLITPGLKGSFMKVVLEG